MSSEESSTDALAASLHRSILGVLLAILALVGLSIAVNADGNLLMAVAGAVAAVGAVLWIGWLFVEGYRDS